MCFSWKCVGVLSLTMMCAILLGGVDVARGQMPLTAVPVTDSPQHGAFVQRLHRTAPEDVDAIMELAEWAEAHQLYGEAMLLYRRVLWLNPAHPQAYPRMIQSTIRRGELEPLSVRSHLLGELGTGFSTYHTEHFLIAHDADSKQAERRARMLELARKQFYSVFSRHRYRPLPLMEHLQVVVFSEHEAFRNYGTRVDRVLAHWPDGYYSKRSNRIVLFDYQSSPRIANVAERIEKAQQQQMEIRKQIDKARREGNQQRAVQLYQQLQMIQQSMQQDMERFQMTAGLSNIAHTIHEAAHQLAYNSGIQKIGVTYPLWFTEGLATSFETVTPGAPFGPGEVNPHRLHAFELSYKREHLIPLRTFVQIVTLSKDDANYRDAAYAQSWALFYYLFNHHPDAMRSYTFAKRAQMPGHRSKQQLLDEFIEHFGDIDTLEKQWIHHIRSMK